MDADSPASCRALSGVVLVQEVVGGHHRGVVVKQTDGVAALWLSGSNRARGLARDIGRTHFRGWRRRVLLLKYRRSVTIVWLAETRNVLSYFVLQK